MSLRAKPQSCVGCACHSHGSDFSQIEGTGANRVLVVAEASGEAEQREELPLRPHARAGSIFERCIRRMSLDRQSFSITNVLRCRPRNNWLDGAPWEYNSITHCRGNLESAIADRRPQAILAMGTIPSRELTGLSGKYLGVLHLAGYVLPYWNTSLQDSSLPQIPVIPCYHPAYLGRGKADHQGVFSRIVNRAVNISKGSDKSWIWGVDPKRRETWGSLEYVLHPSLDEADAFTRFVLQNPNLTIAMDIETSESLDLDEDAREGYQDTEIRLAQFSIGKGKGIAFPWAGHFRHLAMLIFNSCNAKYGHNWNLFDHKVIRTVAAREGLTYAPRGPLFDTLDMFHHWQPDLAANLQAACQFIQAPFPWKHLAGTDIEFYGCCDVDNDWQLGEMLVETLKRDGIWGDHERGYVGMVHELRPVLAGMEDRGVPIDDAARVRLGAAFDKSQVELGEELDGMVPVQCRGIDPKEGLKQFPKEVKDRCVAGSLLLRKGDMGFAADGVIDPDVLSFIAEPFTDKDGDRYHYDVREFDSPALDAKGQPSIEKVYRWCRIYAFNPNSKDQVFAYMDAMKHTRPKDKHREDDEGNNPDTSAAKELLRLANKTGDGFYLKVTEYRGYTKMKSTYVEGFKPGADGRVHPAFTFDTAIGQTSSRNPNSHNFPKLKPTYALAQEMRGMVCAPPGFEISEWDYKSCHALTLAFLAEDSDYMRLTRIDVHSAVAGHMLGCWNVREILKESDDALRARFKWLKSDPVRKLIRDDQAKHAILGIGNGLRAKGLYDRYMENFIMTSCPDCHKTGIIPKPSYLPKRPKCRLCSDTGHPGGLKIAQRFLDLLELLFPKLFAYLESQRKLAHEEMKLISPTLFVRRFYEVYRWDSRKSDWGHGDQAEQAVAFRHPNIAFCHIRRAMKNLANAGLDAKYGLFNNIHDSFMFCYPKEMREEHIREVYPILVEPNPILVNATAPRGLVIGVEASAGERWNKMEEFALPKLVLP